MATTELLDVNLDLEGTGLGVLILAFSSEALALHRTGQTVSLALIERSTDSESAVQRFCALIDPLSAKDSGLGGLHAAPV